MRYPISARIIFPNIFSLNKLSWTNKTAYVEPQVPLKNPVTPPISYTNDSI